MQMKYKNIVLVSALSIIVSGCFLSEATKGLGSTSQEVSGGGSGNQGVGEAKVDIGSSNRDRYERSNIQQEQTSTESTTANDVGTGAKSLIGADDNSINNTESNSQTKNSTDDDSFVADVINMGEKLSTTIFRTIARVVENNITALIAIFIYWLGRRHGFKLAKKVYDA